MIPIQISSPDVSVDGQFKSTMMLAQILANSVVLTSNVSSAPPFEVSDGLHTLHVEARNSNISWIVQFRGPLKFHEFQSAMLKCWRVEVKFEPPGEAVGVLVGGG